MSGPMVSRYLGTPPPPGTPAGRPRASGMGSVRLLTYAIFSSAFRFRLSRRGFGFMNQSIAESIDAFEMIESARARRQFSRG